MRKNIPDGNNPVAVARFEWWFDYWIMLIYFAEDFKTGVECYIVCDSHNNVVSDKICNHNDH